MKKLFILPVSIALLFGSCGEFQVKNSQVETIEIPQADKKVQQEVVAENKAEVQMEVEGMTCAMGCAKYIEDKVGDMNGVVASTVNFEEKMATFEFDKTKTSPEAIQEFISNIHDGQYKAKVAGSESNDDVKSSDNSEEEVVASVKNRINLSFPQLFTYFIKQIR